MNLEELSKLNIGFSRDALVLNVQTKEEAKQLLYTKAKVLAVWANKFGRREFLINFPGSGNSPYQIPASIAKKYINNDMNNLIVMPGIQIAEMKLSLPILRVFGEFLEYPERKSGLIRLSDERQIAVSESSRALFWDWTLEDAVMQRRSNYWYLPDLAEVKRLTQINLEPDNPNSRVEFSWRCPGETWRRYTNEYRLVTDAYGTVYQVSTSFGYEEISAPVV
ncbi:hypothetical protein G7B40_031090 [Aetokthonos hydrillicola Thurmond2011]|jgi:hypothetical protein|uniref:Uncharacterized protein n=1 Tax=Aetokthonos hydrillicola Thurmond2011 TaxID=2712845 RepID=A0AAP5M8B5_9CYAN|nr:hypothetical protein [Aetokthonos hydrillicola]MBO3462123.1 hypothetical protein [Aetokthonos hydrillicola CCALA 1050]MBW4589717.1 hypothetical protein [Aetokthonos hydrillicola CCALA 1050]MDR9898971.1 hypothetical protein [Aetokthonos hydrillicola Thurmond2011]